MVFSKTFSFFTLLVVTSCSTPSRDKIDYIIYGTYAGECSGHCSLMFKLDKTKLLVDTTGSFFNNWEKTVTFKDDTLAYKDFSDAQEIRHKIPSLLRNS